MSALFLLLASLSFGQSTGTVDATFPDFLNQSNMAKDIQELQSGRPRITGLPTFANGIKFADGTVQVTSPTASVSGSTLTWVVVGTTYAVNDSCVGFKVLASSTVYEIDFRGTRNGSSYPMIRVNEDSGANYYGGWRLDSGNSQYVGVQNGTTNIAMGDTANAAASTFNGGMRFQTEWGLIKRVGIAAWWNSPNVAADTYFGSGRSGGLYNGGSTFTSIQICVSASTWTGDATLLRLIR